MPSFGGLSFRTILKRTGARNVVPITINKIAASREGFNNLALVPSPRKIKPTSPLGIIPKPTNRLVVGLGMMPRGEVGLIFLGLGTSAKLLTPSLEAAILLMVIGTTFLAPVLLRIVLKDKPPNDGNKISDDVAADPVGLL